MAWIELHDTLPDHLKVRDVADALRLDKDMVVGKLIRLWLWSLTNREDGVFDVRDNSTIAEVMRYKGKPAVLVEALVKSRLLDVDGDKMRIHDWEERVCMLLEKRKKQRAQTRQRVRNHRKAVGESETVGETECNALHERYETDEYAPCNAATVPNRTLLDDEDDDDDDSLRARARERATEAIMLAYRTEIGREASNAETRNIARIAVTLGTQGIVHRAIRAAALNGAKTVYGYVEKIMRDWHDNGIRTDSQLDEYLYLCDCRNGKVAYADMDAEEAQRRINDNRERNLGE